MVTHGEAPEGYNALVADYLVETKRPKKDKARLEEIEAQIMTMRGEIIFSDTDTLLSLFAKPEYRERAIEMLAMLEGCTVDEFKAKGVKHVRAAIITAMQSETILDFLGFAGLSDTTDTSSSPEETPAA